MITLSIRYTIDPRKRSDFERYAQALREIIPRCGGESSATGCRRSSPGRRTSPWP